MARGYAVVARPRASRRIPSTPKGVHSKKLENHGHMIALYFMHYNYCKIHSTLRVTPAMEAGLADHVWEVEELLALLS